MREERTATSMAHADSGLVHSNCTNQDTRDCVLLVDDEVQDVLDGLSLDDMTDDMRCLHQVHSQLDQKASAGEFAYYVFGTLFDDPKAAYSSTLRNSDSRFTAFKIAIRAFLTNREKVFCITDARLPIEGSETSFANPLIDTVRKSVSNITPSFLILTKAPDDTDVSDESIPRQDKHETKAAEAVLSRIDQYFRRTQSILDYWMQAWSKHDFSNENDVCHWEGEDVQKWPTATKFCAIDLVFRLDGGSPDEEAWKATFTGRWEVSVTRDSDGKANREKSTLAKRRFTEEKECYFLNGAQTDVLSIAQATKLIEAGGISCTHEAEQASAKFKWPSMPGALFVWRLLRFVEEAGVVPPISIGTTGAVGELQSMHVAVPVSGDPWHYYAALMTRANGGATNKLRQLLGCDPPTSTDIASFITDSDQRTRINEFFEINDFNRVTKNDDGKNHNRVNRPVARLNVEDNKLLFSWPIH